MTTTPVARKKSSTPPKLPGGKLKKENWCLKTELEACDQKTEELERKMKEMTACYEKELGTLSQELQEVRAQ